LQGLADILQTMRYKKQDIIKIFMILMSSVFLYLSIKELRVALSGSLAAAQTVPCTTPTPSIQPSATPSATPFPTPTITPTPLPESSIFLTEFMACPASGNEWLELYNTSNTTVVITNWQVVDGANNKKTINGSIPPLSFAAFEWSGSLLNNTGDSFKVLTTAGQVIADAEYSTCSSGISFVYENGEWVPALESPAQQTSISESTIQTASISAVLNTDKTHLDSDSSEISSLSSLFPVTTNSNKTNFDYNSPSLLTTRADKFDQISEEKSPTQQSKTNTASAISVILGGLLQLLPGSYALYENFFKQHT
jgi:hypothetical protein